MELLDITYCSGHADNKETPFSFISQSFSLLPFLNCFGYIGSLLHSGRPDIALSTLLPMLSTISNCHLWNYFQPSWNSYPLKADRSKHKVFFLLLCSTGCGSHVHRCMLIQVQMTVELAPVRHIIECNSGFGYRTWIQAQQIMSNMSWYNFC